MTTWTQRVGDAAKHPPRVRIVAVATASALAASVMVAGPLAPPARAVDASVGNATEFSEAIDDINDGGAGPHTITLTNDIDFVGEAMHDLTASGNVTIDGAGHDIMCSGNYLTCDMWLDVWLSDDGVFTLRDATVTGFRARALRVTLTETVIDNVDFEFNSLERGDALVDALAHGGALYVENTGSEYRTTITGSSFANNWTRHLEGVGEGGAAVIHGYVTIANTTFTENFSHGSDGASSGAVRLGWFTAPPDLEDQEPSSLTDVTFVNNGALSDLDAYGGALVVSGLDMTLEDVQFSDNFVSSDSDTPGGDYMGGAAYFGLSDIDLYDVSAERNISQGDGGGLYVSNSTGYVTTAQIVNNSAVRGGGIFIDGAPSLGIESSTVAHNAAASGAGVYINASNTGIMASTIAANRGSAGAGIYGIDSFLGVYAATIADNGADAQAGPPSSLGQVGGDSSFEVEVTRTVIAQSAGDANCHGGIDLASGGYNRADDTSCDFGAASDHESASFDSQLDQLGDFGGFTSTMPPLPGSPLIDAIVSADCSPSELDQRGVSRHQGLGCDIGAVEAFEVIQGPLETPGGEVWVRILNASGVDEPMVLDIGDLSPAPPAGVAFPYGALSFEIEVWDEGWPVDIQVFSPGPTNQLWKLFDGAWVQPPGATSENGEGGTLWTFRVVDGGFGDNDLDTNAVIIDPVAAGVGAAFTG